MEYILKDGRNLEIRKAREDEWVEATSLAFKVFLRFEAEDYGRAGIDEFAEFLSDPLLESLFKLGKYIVLVAVVDEKIVGIGSLRSGNFISLLFVDEEYHRLGIGSRLMDEMMDILRETTSFTFAEVHSSPYAEGFYYSYGFKNTGEITKLSNILYIPMEFIL